jgi:hypothetical protein
MSANTAATTPHVGERVELGRYRTARAERILIGQRVAGSSASPTSPRPAKGAATWSSWPERPSSTP